MLQEDAIARRGQALENQYFQHVDHHLLQELKQSEEHKKRIQELTETTGVQDSNIAEHLLEAGIDASNIAALTLTPLVFVAWASGSVSPEERQGVISAALRRGVDSNPLAFRLLEQWLQTRPPRELWGLWKDYATAVQKILEPATASKLSRRLIQQARVVAEASGGVLGIGKVCANEQRVLDEIAEVLGQDEATPVDEDNVV